MKEQVTSEDITVLVRGFYYKVPHYVLMEEPMLIEIYGNAWCLTDGKQNLEPVRAIIALKQEEYRAYLYVKLNQIDDEREAMTAYVKQFDDDVLTSLKRELAFFAGSQFKEAKMKKHASQ